MLIHLCVADPGITGSCEYPGGGPGADGGLGLVIISKDAVATKAVAAGDLAPFRREISEVMEK